MASSGSILGSFSGKPTSTNRPKIYWSITQNSSVTPAYSDVTASLYFWQLSSTYWAYNLSGTHNNTSNINASTSLAYTNFDTRSLSGDILIRSRTVRVYHNADGTKNCYIAWSGNTEVSWGTYSFGDTVTLDTITRNSAVTTSAASSVTYNSATANGNVTDAGIPANTEKGVYWGYSSGSQPYKIAHASGGDGAFTISMSSLSPNTTYYYKAYTYNARYGTIYGSVVSFTTSAVAPSLTTSAVSSVYSIKATGNGNITSVYGANATRRGFCYKVGTTGDPTIANSTAYDDGTFGTGAFSKVITGLTPATNYRVRPYATNSAGTGYGTTVQLTTLTDEHSLTFSDSMHVGESYSFRKALKMAGVLLSGVYGGWYVGANYWAGGFTRNFIENFVDSLKVKDTMSKIAGYVKGLVESIVLSESFTAGFARAVAFLDSIIARSALDRVYALARGWIESIHIVDNFSKFVGNVRAFVESISLTEVFSASMVYLKTLVDNIVASDLYEKTIGKLLISTVVVRDTITQGLQYIRNFVESVIVTDLATILRLLIRDFVDTIHVIDNFISNMGRYFVDSIHIGENWIKTFVINLIESINVADLLSGFKKDYTRLYQESITLSQNIAKHVNILVTSLVTVLEGDFWSKINGQFIEWAREIRKVGEWLKRGKDTDNYIKIERKLNDWELREKDLGSYQSNVKSLDDWTKLRKK